MNLEQVMIAYGSSPGRLVGYMQLDPPALSLSLSGMLLQPSPRYVVRGYSFSAHDPQHDSGLKQSPVSEKP